MSPHFPDRDDLAIRVARVGSISQVALNQVFRFDMEVRMKKSAALSDAIPAKIVFGLLGGLVVTLIWVVLSVEGDATPQMPHDVPIAVVGSHAAVAPLAAGLERGGAFQVIKSPTEASAVTLVDQRRADAIINLDTHQLQTAQVASTLTATLLEQMFSSPTNTLHLTTTDIKPYGPGDPTPLGLFFITLSFVLGSIPAGVAFTLLSKSRRVTSLADARVRIGVIAVYSILQALAMALIVGVVILGYGGHAFLVIWLWGVLMSAACMTTAVAGLAAFGLPGLAFSVLPIMDFGVPAAPVPGPWNWQPTLFRVLGPFDPFGATANGLHNGIYFPAASQVKNIGVLAGWIIVPLVVVVALGCLAQRQEQSSRSVAADRLAPTG
jgi:hypothetical protein